MSPDGASGRPALRVAASLLLASLALAGCSAGPARSREIAVEMHFSRYLPATLTVAAGTTVSFELRNTDPIAHEFVIGTEAEQLAHERGNPNDPHTAQGQAAIPGDRTLLLRYTFTTPGVLIYACHRPGHYQYGMRGVIRITG